MSNLGNSPRARDIANVLHPYTNLAVHEEKGPLIIERGKGIYVYDDSGKEYIEGLAGLWCTALGFAEEELIQAAVDQMRKLPAYHTFGSKGSMPTIELAERLKAIAPVPFSKALFVNSGSEANDTQVKIVRYYNNAIGRPLKKKIIARTGGYHGVTVAAASLTGLANNHRDFDLPIPGILHTDKPHYYHGGAPGESEEDYATRLANNLDALIQKEGPETVAAFIAEPVMGAGGVVVPPRTYFEKVQAVLKKYDVLMIVDEVICGFMRTGNMWGSQTFGIKPDLLSCAKQLSSAYMPIAAVLVSEPIYQAMIDQSKKIGVFAHGYTYGGHPVPAAVALKTLEIYEKRNMLDHVKSLMPRFQARLQRLGEHPLVGEARGVGLLAGVELVADKKAKQNFLPARGVGAFYSARAQEHGLISRAMINDTIGICPPLVITEAEVDELFNRMEKALDETEAWVNKEGHRKAA